MDKITKNMVEVIGEEQIEELIKNKNPIKVYWGTATTGCPSFAYICPLLKIKDLVEVGMEVTILFADIHAILDNLKTSPELVENRTNFYKFLITSLLEKLGVDMSKIKFVIGSYFQKNQKYIVDLYNLTSVTSIASAKRAGSEVVKQSSDSPLSSLLYPLLQALDEEYLDADIQLGGLDQRKIFVFARECMPKLDYKKRSYLINPLISGLTKSGKMSSSDKDSKIDFMDSDESIINKIKKAYSVDKIVKGNGILSILKYILFEIYQEGILFKRPDEYGSDIFFKNYNTFEKAFVDGIICSADIKPTVSNLVILFISNIRTMIIDSGLYDIAYP